MILSRGLFIGLTLLLSGSRVDPLSLVSNTPEPVVPHRQISDPDVLRTQMIKIMFDSLAAANASVATWGRDNLMQMIDDGVNQVDSDGFSEVSVREALHGTRLAASLMIEDALANSGRVRFGESTPQYTAGICPLYPFC